MLSQRLKLAKQATRKYTISSKDGPGKFSTLTVKVHAGSRYATKDGIAHLLSRFNFQNTINKSALRLARESELLGGQFKSSVDREYITLSTTFLKEDLPYYVNALGNVLYKTAFRPYELPESVLPAAQEDLMATASCPIYKAEDLLYNVTFRKGLGNTILYDNVNKISLEDIKDYANKVYTKENMEIIGQGINEVDLKKFVNDSLFSSLPSGSSLITSVQPKTYVSEARVRFVGESVGAIAVPVVKEEFATYEVLSRYLDSALSELSSLISKIKFDKYNDVGLFSLYVKGDASTVSSNLKKIVSELKTGKDISLAKDITNLQLALQGEAAISPVELDISSVKDFKLRKFSYVAVGDVSNLPFADEL